MKSRHTNIKFITEAEKNNQLTFLNINITKYESFLKEKYRKPTFSGIYMSYNSLIPSEHKIGLVTELLERYFQIASSYEIVHNEIEKLKIS